MCSSAPSAEAQEIKAMGSMKVGDLDNASVPSHRDLPTCSSVSSKEVQLTETGIKRNLSKRIRDVNGYRHRAAALCVRRAVGDHRMNSAACPKVALGISELEILLVSGRGEKNYWVLPGGGVEKEESTEQAVLREFKEEAGIQGAIIAAIGEFTDDERYHKTTIFMLSVIEVFDEWEDFASGRKRRWMNVDDALKNIKKSQIAMVEQSLIVALEILNKTS